MCGIVGAILAVGPERERRIRLERSCAQLRHRGPDGMGVYVDEVAALGAVRLAIRAPAEGRQPWRTSDGSVLVFNGEIYGLEDLRARLTAHGIDTSSRSDTVMLGEALVRWGADVLSDLDGMFAFALWSPRDRTLLLARDRWGEKPLYISRLPNGGLVFASELEALRPWPGIDWRIDERALACFLAHSYIPGRQTGWREIEKVRPGEVMRWSTAALKRWTYFSPPVPSTTGSMGDRSITQRIDTSASKSMGSSSPLHEDYGRVRTVLEHSVRERLSADRPVGLLLSGGIDSSAIAAIAAREAGPLPAWTIGWSAPDYDESAYARRVAEHLKLPHQVIRVEPHHIVENLDALLEPYGEPFADESLIPTGLVCRAAGAEVRVLLSGDGGDEMFGGYERYYWPPSTLEEYLETFCAARLAWVSSLLVNGEVGEGVHAIHIGEDPVERMPADRARYGLVHTLVGRLDPREIRRQVDLRTYLPDDILTKVDRASMQASVEVRAPMLSLAVTRVALALPAATVWERSLSKEVLRQSVVDLLPPEILQRPKQGFGVPLVHWLRGPLRAWMRERVLGGVLRAAGYFRDDIMEQVVLEHETARQNHARLIFNLIVLESWLRRQQRASRMDFWME